MNILFVCKYNRFRSKIAENYFKKINKSKKIRVKSAGVFVGNYPLSKRQKRVAKELGLNIKGKSKPISTKLLKWQDLIIIISDDIPKSLFKPKSYNNKVKVWKIKDDMHGNTFQGTEKIIKKIMNKVDKLNQELKYDK